LGEKNRLTRRRRTNSRGNRLNSGSHLAHKTLKEEGLSERLFLLCAISTEAGCPKKEGAGRSETGARLQLLSDGGSKHDEKKRRTQIEGSIFLDKQAPALRRSRFPRWGWGLGVGKKGRIQPDHDLRGGFSPEKARPKSARFLIRQPGGEKEGIPFKRIQGPCRGHMVDLSPRPGQEDSRSTHRIPVIGTSNEGAFPIVPRYEITISPPHISLNL